MKESIAALSDTASYSMALYVRDETEFNISEGNREERHCLAIAGLNIFLSREDLVQLGEAIAEYMGGTFAPAGSVLAVAKVWAGQE